MHALTETNRVGPQVTREVFEASKGRLKVVGRAGVGIDNVDLAAASENGCLVVNGARAGAARAARLHAGGGNWRRLTGCFMLACSCCMQANDSGVGASSTACGLAQAPDGCIPPPRRRPQPPPPTLWRLRSTASRCCARWPATWPRPTPQ